jgi:hypothetical protein
MEENLNNTPDAIANSGAPFWDTKVLDGPFTLPDKATQSERFSNIIYLLIQGDGIYAGRFGEYRRIRWIIGGANNIGITERYAHLSTATLQDAANSVTDYLDRALDKTSEQYF